MFLRVVTFAGGLAGAAGLSQFPEFSQQYTQRLGGAVDEISRYITEFDADSAQVGMTRTEALNDLALGGEMGKARAITMQHMFARHDRLQADLAALRYAGPFIRAYNATRFTDAEIARAAWGDFKPAMPLTFEGIVFAGVGFLAGLAAIGGLMSLLRMPFRRRQTP